MALQLPANFKIDIQGRDTNLIPFVSIGNWSQVFSEDPIPATDPINISTNQITVNLGSEDGIPLHADPILLNIPSIKESIDVRKRNYKISSVNLDISNLPYNGRRFSERVEDSLINTECRIFWVSPSTTVYHNEDLSSHENPSRIFQVYNGFVRRYEHDAEKVRITLEDRSQSVLHRDVPIANLGAEESVPDKYKNKPIPMVYGYVRTPIVIENMLSETPATQDIKLYVDSKPLDWLSEKLYIYKDDHYYEIHKYQNYNDFGLENEYQSGNIYSLEEKHKYIMSITGVLYPGGDILYPSLIDNLAQLSVSPKNVTFQSSGFHHGGNPVEPDFSNSGLDDMNIIGNPSTGVSFQIIRMINFDTFVHDDPDAQPGLYEKAFYLTYTHDLKSSSLVETKLFRDLGLAEHLAVHGYLNIDGTWKSFKILRYASEGNSVYTISENDYATSYPYNVTLVALFGRGVANQAYNYQNAGTSEWDTFTLPTVDEASYGMDPGEYLVNNINEIAGEVQLIFMHGHNIPGTEYVQGEFIPDGASENLVTINDMNLRYSIMGKNILSSKLYADVGGRPNGGVMMQNIYLIIEDIMREVTGDSSFTYSNDSVINDDYMVPRYAFTVDKTTNSKKLIEELSSTLGVIPRFDNMGNFKFSAFPTKRVEAMSEDKNGTIKDADIINFSFSRTKIEDVYTKVDFKYDWDYGVGDYTGFHDTEAQQLFSLHRNEFYGLKDDHSESTLIVDDLGKYTRDHIYSSMIPAWLVSWYCNQHLIVKVKLPLKYMNLEIGDVIRFNSLLGGIKPYNIDYTADNERLNGQRVFPNFTITSTNKTLEFVEIEAVQNHNLSIAVCGGSFDCMGNCGGDIEVDVCGICDGGVTNPTECAECPEPWVSDCAGECGGDAVIDACGVCGGGCDDLVGQLGCPGECGCNDIPLAECDCDGNVEDCAGVCGGDAYLDNCGECIDGTNVDCDADCFGVPMGNADLEPCGLCLSEDEECPHSKCFVEVYLYSPLGVNVPINGFDLRLSPFAQEVVDGEIITPYGGNTPIFGTWDDGAWINHDVEHTNDATYNHGEVTTLKVDPTPSSGTAWVQGDKPLMLARFRRANLDDECFYDHYDGIQTCFPFNLTTHPLASLFWDHEGNLVGSVDPTNGIYVAHLDEFADIDNEDYPVYVYRSWAQNSDAWFDLCWIEKINIPVFPHPSSGCSLTGDLNLDGAVNVIDVVMLTNATLAGGYESDLVTNNCFDLNGDGILNVLDIVLLVNLALN